jgi:hypothetical protein
MNYWLVKSEPGTYSWADLARDGRTVWDGVRNFQARNNLRAMRDGDWRSSITPATSAACSASRASPPIPTPDPKAKDWTVVGRPARLRVEGRR